MKWPIGVVLLLLVLLGALAVTSPQALTANCRKANCSTPTPSPTPTPTPTATKTVGMTAANWDTQLAAVGRCGVEARRVYSGPVGSTGQIDGQWSLVEQVIADGMTPWVSYKPPEADVNAGKYDAQFRTIRDRLQAYGKPIIVTYHHEPHGDGVTPTAFKTAYDRFAGIMASASNLIATPIINGWLLDNMNATNRANFADYVSPLMLRGKLFSIDTYQNGTATAPDASKPAGRTLDELAAWLDTQGAPDLPIGIGEYNNYTATAMRQTNAQILNIPEVKVAVIWNSNGNAGSELSGDRLTAYKELKAQSPPVLHEEGC